MTRAPARRQTTNWIIVTIIAVLAALIALALLRAAGQPPARRLRVEFPGIGQILVTLQLIPDPPRPGGTEVRVQVDEIAGAPVRGVIVSATVNSEPGPQQTVGLEPAGAGAHHGIVAFPGPGSWWLDVEVIGTPDRARVRFPVDVDGTD
jgi:hypothetical protein